MRRSCTSRPRAPGGLTVVLAALGIGLVSMFINQPAGAAESGAQQAAAASSLAGKWSGDGVELVLEPDGEEYAGRLTYQGMTYPAQVGADGRGSFTIGEQRFELVLRAEGEAATLESGGRAYSLKRAAPPQPQNPLGAGGSGGARAPQPGGADADRPAPAGQEPAPGWQVYRHPTGVFLEHPEGWRAQDTQFGVALIPPDFDQNAEIILATGQPAGTVTDPADAQVGQYFDGVMAQLAPTLRRSGEPRAIACRGGKGALYEYAGSLPTGQAAKARIYATILGSNAVGIAALATEERMTRRASTLDRIFASIGQGEPARDPALVGSWRQMESSATQGPGGNTYLFTDRVFTLHADGRLTTNTTVQADVGVKDAEGRDTGNVASQSERAGSGSWSAKDGRVFVQWPDGTSTSASYKVFSNGVEVTPDGGKKIALERVQ